MARFTEDNFSGNSSVSEENSSNITIDATAQNHIAVPHGEFIADANIMKDGQDLTLEAPDGSTVTIENYFSADPAPIIEAPNGAVLSPELVQSFAKTPAQYAGNVSDNDESPIGAVEEVSGEATVTRADGSSDSITIGMPIYQGDIIETTQDGAVNITFLDESSMAISEGARMSVDEFDYSENTESGVTDLSVLRGVFVYTSGLIGRDDPDDVKIDTPIGSIGIRGTIIAGRINPDGESEVTVIEGAIVVKNAMGEQTLDQQFETVKISGFNSSIQNMGVMDGNHMNKSYGSASSVAPKLFSSVNDTIEEQKQDEQIQQEEIKAEEEAKEEVLEVEAEEAQDKEAKAEERQEALEQKAKDAAQDDTMDDPMMMDQTMMGIKANTVGPGGPQVLGQPAPTGPGTVNVQPAPSAGPPPPPQGTTNNQPPPPPPNGSTSGSANVSYLIEVGDLDHDGYIDFLSIDTDPSTGERFVTLDLSSGGPFQINSPSPSPVDFGAAASDIGDYDGDGTLDFAISDPLEGLGGKVFIFSGASLSPIGALNSDFAGQLLGDHLEGVGDMNGDGKSDFVMSGGSNGSIQHAFISFGTTGSVQKNVTLTTSNDIIGIKSIGNFNGDAHDDIAIAVYDGTNVNVHILFGNDTLGGGITIDSLPLAQSFVVGSNNLADFIMDDPGDPSDDGFNDFFAGFAGSETLILGSDVLSSVSYGVTSATATGESLVGTGNMGDGGHFGISMKGNSNNQHFIINNAGFKKIEAGEGIDNLIVDASMDFTAIDFEQIEHIDTVHVNSGSTLTLTKENVFNLLQTSDNGEIRFIADPTASGLDISGTGQTNIQDALGATFVDSDGSFTEYAIGDYTLFVDNDMVVGFI